MNNRQRVYFTEFKELFEELKQTNVNEIEKGNQIIKQLNNLFDQIMNSSDNKILFPKILHIMLDNVNQSILRQFGVINGIGQDNG